MTIFARARTFGNYGGVPVSSGFFQQVQTLFNQGVGTVNSRLALRQAGFTFRDAAVSSIRQELATLAQRSAGLNRIRSDFRPGANTLTRVNREFKTRYFYTTVGRFRSAIDGTISNIPISFGNDRLLTIGEIRETTEGIMEQIQLAPSGSIAGEGDEIDSIEFTGAMDRGPF